MIPYNITLEDQISNYYKQDINSNKKSTANNFFKTKMCPFFLKGICSKGSRCLHAHSLYELREMPNLKKIRLCKFYENGFCPKGSECIFAHGQNDLRDPPDYYKISLCVPYMSGKVCKNGDKCRFAHGEAELRTRNVSYHYYADNTPSNIDPEVTEPLINNYSIIYPSTNNDSLTNNLPTYPWKFDSLKDKLKKSHCFYYEPIISKHLKSFTYFNDKSNIYNNCSENEGIFTIDSHYKNTN